MSNFLDKIKSLGVKDPQNPSDEDWQIILNAYIKEKTLDVDAFNTYMKFTSESLKSIVEALKSFTETERDVSVKVLDIISKATSIFEKELAREISDEERSKIRQQIIDLVNMAREESKGQREANQGYGKMLLCFATAVFGIAAAILLGGGKKDGDIRKNI